MAHLAAFWFTCSLGQARGNNEPQNRFLLAYWFAVPLTVVHAFVATPALQPLTGADHALMLLSSVAGASC